MYTLTAASAAVLNSDHRRVVLYAMVGVIWGWAVAGVAFLPYAVLLLLVGNPMVYLPAGMVFLTGTIVPMIGCDRLFYGKWTVSPAFCLSHSASQQLAGALPFSHPALQQPELAVQQPAFQQTTSFCSALDIELHQVCLQCRLRLHCPCVLQTRNDTRFPYARMLCTSCYLPRDCPPAMIAAQSAAFAPHL